MPEAFRVSPTPQPLVPVFPYETPASAIARGWREHSDPRKRTSSLRENGPGVRESVPLPADTVE